MSQAQFALVGNPNCGKTSVFNSLTKSKQHIGNWPGVTVEKKEGTYHKNNEVAVQDLPGIYSLSSYTPEEVIAGNYLVDRQADCLLNVVDGTNLERNLYLTMQLLELGIPMVLGVNMMDIVKKSEKSINFEKLSYGLGVPVVGLSALKNQGLDKLMDKGLQVTDKGKASTYPLYDERLETALYEIAKVLGLDAADQQARWYTIKLFEKDEAIAAELNLSDSQQAEVLDIINVTEKIFDDESDAILVNQRYEFVTQLIALATQDSSTSSFNQSDRIDRVVTNRFLALPIFAFVMWLVYYLSIQTVGTIGTDWVNEQLFGDYLPNMIQGALESWQVASWMQDLILNGLLVGVGSVLGFLPQLIVLFFCLAILEDCGYMSRIAFVMDRLFRKFGLSGKSFIPMLIATGCGVPGVMASRTIENEKDRRLTVMLTTFMPCSAKLPVIALIAGAFFPKNSWVAPSAYFIGIGAIVLSGIALKKTKAFSSQASPFIMELPNYHLPQMQNVLRYTYQRAASFVKKAGTIIFVSSLVIWFTSNYSFTFARVNSDASILASLGRLVAPIFAPLGWGSWKATVATITGLVAKENIIGSLGILYGNLGEASETGVEIWGALQADFTPYAAYSFLIFNLLCAPCFAAIGAIHREMGSWRWTMFAVGYQCGLAYLVSFIFYQLSGALFNLHSFGILPLLAMGCLLGMIYLIIRKNQHTVNETLFCAIQEGR